MTRYYAFGSQRVATRENGTLYYLHADHLGSASRSTNATGGKTAEMRYYPYGETRSGNMPTDRRYTGQRHEAGLGLYDAPTNRVCPLLRRRDSRRFTLGRFL